MGRDGSGPDSAGGGVVASVLVRLRHVIRNARLDLRYGRPLASPQNTDYRALDQIFEGRIEADDVLVDVGCGRGRVLNWWLGNTEANRAVGVEIDPVRARSTARRLRRHQRVAVVSGNALDVLPADGTIVYLFNPAGRPFIDQLELRLFEMPALRTVLYYNPKYLSAFVDSGRWKIDEIRLSGHPHAPYSDLAILAPRSRVPDGCRSREARDDVEV